MGDNLMRDVLDQAVDTALRIAALQRKNAELRAELTEAQEKLAAYEDAFKPRPVLDKPEIECLEGRA